MAFKKFTREQTLEIIIASQEAGARGDRETESRLARMLPLHPVLAQRLKSYCGVQRMIDEGFDLSEAVEAFGEKWLHE